MLCVESSRCEEKFASFYAHGNSALSLALFRPSVERSPGLCRTACNEEKLCRRYFMNPSLVFVSGLAVTCLTSLATVIYMQRPLRALLEELCGTRHRADFWTIFSNIAVTLLPAIFA